MAKAGDSSIRKSSKIEAGQRFGRLTAIKRVGTDKWGLQIWRFRCDDGNEIEAVAAEVRRSRTPSCGCFQREMLVARNKARAKHGLWESPEHRIWRNMLYRCENPRCKAYPNYGGRNISVCEPWRNESTGFAAFIADMGPRPSTKHSLDRFPNQSGNYEPSNCRWATSRQQNRNRRDNYIVTYQGRQMTFAEACEIAGLRDDCVRRRIVRGGWSVEKALSEPLMRRRR